MNNKETLQKTISESNLTQEEKNFWDSIILSAPEELIEGINETLLEFPNELPWLTQIYRRKKEAFEIMKSDKEKARELLAQIYKEEKEKLKKLVSN